MPIPSPKMDQIIGSFDNVSGAIDTAAILDLLDFTNLTIDQLDAAGLMDNLDTFGNLDSLSGIKVRVLGNAGTFPTSASITAQIQPAVSSGSMTAASAANVYFGMLEEKTYTVTVASGTNNYGTGNKYYLDGTVSPTIDLVRGGYYEFDQSDSSNGSHPLRFSTTANGTHAGGTEYTTGVTTSSSEVIFRVPLNAPDTLHYYCSNHSGMGGQVRVRDGGFRIREASATTVSAGTIQADGDALRPLDSNLSVAGTINSPAVARTADMSASIATASTIADVTPNYIFFVDSTVVSGFSAPFATVQVICTGIFTDSGSITVSSTIPATSLEKLGEEWSVVAPGNEVWRGI